jgi:chemotaxis protein histidine kinase CheA
MSQPLDRELLLGFLEEARGYLPGIRDGLAAFRADPAARDLLADPHRYVHTIKGAAAMVGLAGLSHFAYAFESAVERLMDGTLPPAADTFAALDRATEQVAAHLDGAEAGTTPDDAAA